MSTDAWSGHSLTGDTGPLSLERRFPRVDDAPIGTMGSLRLAPVVQLAVVEGKRMLRHPVFLAGLALVVLSIVQGASGEEDWSGQTAYLLMTGWSLLWTATMLTAGLVAGRQRFVGDPDLFPGTPIGPSARAAACVLGLAGPAAATAVAAAAFGLRFGLGGQLTAGDPPYTTSLHYGPLQFAQPVFLVVLAGAVGVLIAQLRGGRLPVLVATVVVTFYSGIAVWMFGVHPLRVLVPFMWPYYERVIPGPPADWTTDDPPVMPPDQYTDTWREVRVDSLALGFHLVFVVGLILVATWGACRLAGSERPPRWLATVGLALAVVGGLLAVITGGANGWGQPTSW
jgi:hypothetical protein